MKIIAHSANIEALLKRAQSGMLDSMLSDWDSVELVRNDYFPRTKPSGKYRLPDGREVAKDEFSLRTRFVDYGPEDLEWLVMAGIVKECQEMHFVLMKEPMFRAFSDFGVMPFQSRSIIRNYV